MASRMLRATVLGVVALVAVAGCGSGGSGSSSAHISGKAFDSNPCGVYSFTSLVAVVQPVLTRMGWPNVGPAGPTHRPDTRLSAQVQRCRYPLAVADTDSSGDQAITITVYDEMSNGRALMDACEGRRLAGTAAPSPVAPVGDESCVDADGQWRFRIADRFVSVSVDIPPRTQGNGEVLPLSSTTTFVAPGDPQARAEVGLAVAKDLARRLG